MDNTYVKSTPIIGGPLTDENGAAVPVASINYFKVCLYDKLTETIINSRDNVDLYASGAWTAVNSMKATVDSSGNCTIKLAAADQVMATTGANSEVHVLEVRIKTSGALPTEIVEKFEFNVIATKKLT